MNASTRTPPEQAPAIGQPVAAPPPPGVAPPMAALVRRGMSWFAILNVVAKVAAFATNIVLAWLLSPHDFGVYGAAIAISAVVTILRDGGVRELIVQRGAAQYAALSGPVFWYGLAVSAAAAVVLAAAAPFVAAAYHMPDLAAPLVIIAISLPLGVPGSVLRSKLRVDLRFGTVGNIQLISSLLRYGSTVLFALMGAGVLSFVLPLIVMALYEWAAGVAATGENVLRGAVRLDRWPEIFHATKWLIVGSFAFMMVEQGDYLIAGLFVDERTLGFYFFGAQLLFQTCYSMLSYTAQLVLLPSLVRLVDEPERKRQAALRFFNALMLVASPAALGLAVTAPALFQALLAPEWMAAVLPLQLLAVFYPLRCTVGLTWSILLAQNRFKRMAGYMIVEGVLLMIAATVAAAVWRTPEAIAAAVGSSLAITRLAVCTLTFRGLRANANQILGACLSAWTLAFAAAAITLAVARAVPFDSPIVRLVAHGTVFCAAYAALCRVLIARQLLDALVVAPARLQPLLARLMLLNPASATAD